MQKKKVFGLMTAAGCALYAASAMGEATTVFSEGFESPATDGAAVTTLANWTGYGTVTASNYTSAVDTSVGRPIGGGSNVLVVEGRVARNGITTSASKPATVDMMVQIATPDDALAFPSGTTESDIQIAVGVETNATLKVYCKNKSGTPGWYALGTTPYDVGSWHRVSFTFDYANDVKKLCQIRVDGDPILTSNGYFSTDTTKNDGVDGSWYALNASVTSLTNIQVIGSTAIDDLLVKHDTAATTVDSVLPALADASTPKTVGGVDIDKTWIEKQGITRTQAEGNAVDYATTGMTVAQKYAAGYDVGDGKKFELKDMTLSGSNATLKFNEANIPAGYKYVIETADNPAFTGAASTDVTGHTEGTATIGMGEGNVKYYRIRLVPASN